MMYFHNEEEPPPSPPQESSIVMQCQLYQDDDDNNNNCNNDNNNNVEKIIEANNHDCPRNQRIRQPTLQEADQQSFSPLPLDNFRYYSQMTCTLYSNSYAILFGNMLEWLDFGIFGYSQQELSAELFHGNTKIGWTMFALGYLVRPIGAFLLGQVADETSRKGAFLLGILGMATSTATMALLPAYCSSTTTTISSYCTSHGWISTVCIILLRIIQGFSAGSVAGNVNVIQSELYSSSLSNSPTTSTSTSSTNTTDTTHHHEEDILVSSSSPSSTNSNADNNNSSSSILSQSIGVNNVSGSAASMLSAGIVLGLRYWMGSESYANYGWRIAFLMVVPPCLLSTYFTHTSLPETTTTTTTTTSPTTTTATSSKQQQQQQQRDYRYNMIIHNPNDDNNNNGNNNNNNNNYNDDNNNENNNNNNNRKDDCTSNTNFLLLYNNDTTSSFITTRPPPYKSILFILLSIYIQFAIAAYNNLNVYMIQYAKEHYSMTANSATLLVVIGKFTQMIMTFPTAALSDTIGWFATCALGGLCCTLLAMPMMMFGNRSLTQIWILVGIIQPALATLWILPAPLLLTSICPPQVRSRYTSVIMACGIAFAGFFPLLLDVLVDDSAASSIVTGLLLSIVALVATLGIVGIRYQITIGNVAIYQRPELY